MLPVRVCRFWQKEKKQASRFVAGGKDGVWTVVVVPAGHCQHPTVPVAGAPPFSSLTPSA